MDAFLIEVVIMAALTGVLTGIDTSVLITADMQAYQTPIDALTQKKTTVQNKSAEIDNLSSRITSLDQLVAQLRVPANLQAVTASSSNTDILGASASNGAATGSHTIVVNRLATSEQEVNNGAVQRETWTNKTAVATADTQYLSADDISDNTGSSYKFNFQFGSEAAVSVDLSEFDTTGATLNQLVSKINQSAGYQAAGVVVVDGKSQLGLYAKNTGAAALTITSDNSVAALGGTDKFTQTIKGGAGTADSLVGAGAFVYTYGGVKRTLYTTATTTLSGLRDLINNDSGNAGVSASLLQYDAGNGQVYHLVLSGKDSGASHAITIDDTATSLNGSNGTMDFRGSTFTQTQQAQDAQVRVDGYPTNDWITRDSNSIDDITPGVTYTLQNTGTASVNVSQNTSQLQTNLSNLVSLYNGIISEISTDTGYNADTKAGGVFQGDSIINSLLDPIRSSLVTTVAGFGSKDSFTLAAQIGLTVDKNGQLSLDSTVLSNAITKDYQGVLRLIGAQGSGNSDNDQVQFTSSADSTVAGQYTVRVSYDATGKATAWIKQGSDADWRQMTVNGNVFSGKNGNAEQGLALTGSWDSTRGAYEVTANINVQQGLAGGMYKTTQAILDPVNGTFKNCKDNYSELIQTYTDSLAVKQRMADAMKASLTAKYARMEATLAQLESMKGSIAALTGSQNANSSNSSSSSSGN